MEKRAIFDVPNEDKKSAMIYRIVFLLNTLQFYIGQAVNGWNRYLGHMSSVRHKKPVCRKIHNAMIKHGAENFRFEVVEIVDLSGLTKKESKKKLDERENYWLNPKPYYNLARKANSLLGITHPENAKSRRKGKDNPTSLMVSSYTLAGPKIKTYESMVQASEDTGVDISNISRCCNGIITSITGRMWAFGDADFIKPNFVSRNNKSGFRGVSKSGDNTWISSFYCDGTSYYGGSFATPKEAAIKYNEMAAQHIGNRAKLNEIT